MKAPARRLSLEPGEGGRNILYDSMFTHTEGKKDGESPEISFAAALLDFAQEVAE